MREEAKFLRELSECKRIVDITDYYEKGEHSLMVLEYLEVEISNKHLQKWLILLNIVSRWETCSLRSPPLPTLSQRRNARTLSQKWSRYPSDSSPKLHLTSRYPRVSTTSTTTASSTSTWSRPTWCWGAQVMSSRWVMSSRDLLSQDPTYLDS